MKRISISAVIIILTSLPLLGGCLPLKSKTSQPEPLDVFLEHARQPLNVKVNFPEPEEFSLANGLKIMVVPRHDIPMVYFRAQVRGGSIYDPPDKAGLAYLTGWVLTEGTESYTNDEIDRVMDRHGAIITSVAYNESCIATLTCLSQDTETLFPYFSEILSKAAFREPRLQEARQYITGDLMRIMDDPGELAHRCFRRDVFDGHPYSKPTKGTIEGIRNCTREDVLDFYHRFYTPDHAVLVVVGDVTVPQIKQFCETYLSQWERSSAALPNIPVPEAIHGTRIQVVDKDTAQSHIIIGHIGINRTNPDRFTLDVLNQILGGGGLYSRLATEVRVKRGLTYSIYSQFARREFTGEFLVSTFTRPETTGEAVNVILEELKRIREAPVSESELLDAKLALTGSYPLQFERYEDIASRLVHMMFYGLPLNDIIDYPQKINEVTVDDIQKAAQRYLHPSDVVITVVGPAEKIIAQLETIAPVTIADPV